MELELLSEQKNTRLVNHFDYESLSPKQRSIVQNCTGAIKERLRRTAQDVWEIGQQLVEVRSQLEHGQFEGWLSAEFGWSRRSAYNFINVYEAFSDSTNFAQLDIATSALYKLAAPSVPQSVRNKFLDKAKKGAKITHKEISQALSAAKNSGVVAKPQLNTVRSTKLPVEISRGAGEAGEQGSRGAGGAKNKAYANGIEPQPIAPPSAKILQLIPKARAGAEVPEVEKTPISQPQISSKPVMRKFMNSVLPLSHGGVPSTPTPTEVKSGCWYLFDRINTVFCGDTALAEFSHRSPEATLALAVTSDDWDHDWLIEKASNLIVLQESSLRKGLIEQVISLFSAVGDTVILPWLPEPEMLEIAHRLKRRIVAGDPSPERCQNAIAKVGLPVKQLTI